MSADRERKPVDEQGLAETVTKPAATAGQCSAARAARAASEDLRDPRELQAWVATEILYFRAREHWFMLLHRFAMLGTILCGSAAAASFSPLTFGLGAAFFGGIDLAFDLTGRATEAGRSAQAYMRIAARLEKNNGSLEACKKAQGAILELSAQEPAIFHAARKAAWNKAAEAFGLDQRFVLTGKERLLRHILRFE